MQTIINADKSLSSKCIQYEYDFDYNVTTNPLTIDIIVDNNPRLDDVELCSHYGIDYSKVRELELI